MVLFIIGEIAYVFLITLFIYRFVVTKDSARWKRLGLFLLFIVLGSALFVAEGATGLALVQLVLGMLIFNGMIPTYGTDINFIYIAMGIGYILLSYFMGFAFIAQAMLFGMLSEVIMMKSVKEHHRNRIVEVRRDILQVVAGIVFIIAYVMFSDVAADVIVLSVIMIGVFLLNYAKTMHRKRLSDMIYNLERKNTSLGHGALWLAMGTLMAVSFLGKPYIIAVFAAIFIGDSMATIIGVTYGGKSLPYNRSKSISGSFVYFLSTFAVSFPFIGWIALPIAIAAALVESMPWKIDDNFSVSFVLVVLLIAISSL